MSQFDYSPLALFRTIDQFSHGKLNRDNLRTWLLNFECASKLTHKDIELWIRKFDRNADGALTYGDLVNAMQPLTSFTAKPTNPEEM